MCQIVVLLILWGFEKSFNQREAVMKYLYEKEGQYVCECDACGMKIKIKK